MVSSMVSSARPLRRSIQKYIENPLSEELIQGRFDEGSVIEIDEREGALVFGEPLNHSKEAKKS